MTTPMRALLFACLFSGVLSAQPTQFIDALPDGTRETVRTLYGYVVEGGIWSSSPLPEEAWNGIRQLFEPLNPREGDWGPFDAAMSRNSHTAHDLFDTLEFCLNLTVSMKQGAGPDIPLVDFERPRGAAASRAAIVLRRGDRTAELPLPHVMILQMVLRRTRGMHSVLS